MRLSQPGVSTSASAFASAIGIALSVGRARPLGAPSITMRPDRRSWPYRPSAFRLSTVN